MLIKNIFKDYKVVEPIDQIFVIENVLDIKEIDVLLNFAKTVEDSLWHEQYLKNLKPFCMTRFGRDDVENLVKEGLFEITQNWSDKIITIDNRIETKGVFYSINQRLQLLFKNINNAVPSKHNVIQRMQPGVELKSHYDQHTDPSISNASIIYLNDDYNGGELYFVNKNFTIKPKPGTLIFFPGTEEYEHGVKTVEEGPIRYVLPGFIHYKDFYK